MRLIDTTRLELREFNSDAIPPYAILSHTWGNDEVSIQDLSSPTGKVSEREGYGKIVWTCKLAKKQGIRFAWIDTCCIDKSSSAELTEAINSMFQWYKQAVVCYAFLSDVPSRSLAASRWFTRGWTLQELIAPEKLEFYDSTWRYMGSKLDSPLLEDIERCTKIPEKVLRGSQSADIYPVATRMSWAAPRQTTRVEDKAYCLLGLFGIHMPMIYGEGEMAFRRLQEEVIKRNNDLSIFAWDFPRHADELRPGADRLNDFEAAAGNRLRRATVAPLFAPSPGFFVDNSTIPFVDDFMEFSLSNKGLASKMIIRVLRLPDNRGYAYGVSLGTRRYSVGDGMDVLEVREVRIVLRKIGPGFFFRWAEHSAPSGQVGIAVVDILTPSLPHHILVDPSTVYRVPFQDFRNEAIHIPHQPHVKLVQTSPEHLWDETDRIFLKPLAHSFIRYPMSLLAHFRMKVGVGEEFLRFFVLCNYRRGAEEPVCLIAEYEAREFAELFSESSYEMSQSFQDILQKFPRSVNWTSSFSSLRAEVHISVSTRKNAIKCECIDSFIPVHSLVVDVQPFSKTAGLRNRGDGRSRSVRF